MNSTKHQPRVLVSADSGHGSTTEIARVIGHTLFNDHIAVDMIPPAAVDSVDDYDAVILGSAVYAGHWLASARNFAIRFSDQLAARPVWLFSSGPVGGPSQTLIPSMEREPADVTRIRQAFAIRGHRMFAGKLDPHALSVTQRASPLVFHGMSGDFRDWAVISQWADGIAADLAAEKVMESS
jgi:menaquinone-dependent protoporphyrinogen oxidase